MPKAFQSNLQLPERWLHLDRRGLDCLALAVQYNMAYSNRGPELTEFQELLREAGLTCLLQNRQARDIESGGLGVSTQQKQALTLRIVDLVLDPGHLRHHPILRFLALNTSELPFPIYDIDKPIPWQGPRLSEALRLIVEDGLDVLRKGGEIPAPPAGESKSLLTEVEIELSDDLMASKLIGPTAGPGRPPKSRNCSSLWFRALVIERKLGCSRAFAFRWALSGFRVILPPAKEKREELLRVYAGGPFIDHSTSDEEFIKHQQKLMSETYFARDVSDLIDRALHGGGNGKLHRKFWLDSDSLSHGFYVWDGKAIPVPDARVDCAKMAFKLERAQIVNKRGCVQLKPEEKARVRCRAITHAMEEKKVKLVRVLEGKSSRERAIFIPSTDDDLRAAVDCVRNTMEALERPSLSDVLHERLRKAKV